MKNTWSKLNDHQLGSKQAMFFLEDMSHQQDRFIVPSRDPRTLSSPLITALRSDKPIQASKSKWKIIPFGQNDHTTDMFHPKKIPQRLMRKYANWEQTPGGILVSVPCQTIIYSLIHLTCDTSSTVDERAELAPCTLIWTVFIKDLSERIGTTFGMENRIRRCWRTNFSMPRTSG